jgi:hypothetical protein
VHNLDAERPADQIRIATAILAVRFRHDDVLALERRIANLSDRPARTARRVPESARDAAERLDARTGVLRAHVEHMGRSAPVPEAQRGHPGKRAPHPSRSRL